MPIDFSFTTDHEAKTVVRAVLGEVDIATVQELESRIASFEQGYGLVVDLTSTDFMDSSGIRLLMAEHERRQTAGESFKVAVDGGSIRRLLDVTGVLSHLDTYSSVSEALAT